MSEYKNLTSRDIINFLRFKQSEFSTYLDEFGKKAGLGYDLDKRKLAYRGLYTGGGLCSVASGVLEEGIRRNFGNQIEVYSCFLVTTHRDLETHQKPDSRFWPHHIVQYRIISEDRKFFSDPTYRQFLIRINPDKMLTGIPVTALKIIYGQDCYPKPERAGYLYQKHLQEVEAGKFDQATVEDYNKLLEVFTG